MTGRRDHRQTCRRGVPWLTLTTAALALSLFLQAGPAAPGLVYDRSAIVAGQWWRLLSGHLVHSDLSHLGWDMAGLLVLGWLFEKQIGAWKYAMVLLSGMVAVDIWLWWGQAPLRYCGMSGFLNTLLAAGLVRQWHVSRHVLVPLVGFGAILKIAWETLHGQALLTDTAWPAVPLAHAAGFAGGLCVALLCAEPLQGFFRKSRVSRRPGRIDEIHRGC